MCVGLSFLAPLVTVLPYMVFPPAPGARAVKPDSTATSGTVPGSDPRYDLTLERRGERGKSSSTSTEGLADGWRLLECSCRRSNLKSLRVKELIDFPFSEQPRGRFAESRFPGPRVDQCVVINSDTKTVVDGISISDCHDVTASVAAN